MNNYFKLLVITLLVMISYGSSFLGLINNKAQARLKIESFDLIEGDVDSKKQLVVNYSGEIVEQPELLVNSYMVQLTFKQAFVWPKIEKKVNYFGIEHDTTLMAYQFEKDTVRVRAIFSQKVDDLKDLIKINNADKKITIMIPDEININSNIISAVDNNNIPKKEKLDEAYLNLLMKEKETIKAEKAEKTEKEEKKEIKTDPMNNLTEAKEDISIKTEQIATANDVDHKKNREQKNLISGQQYGKQILKFIFFTMLVLLLFYAIVLVIKKSVLGRGRLGALGNGQLITILGQNYIGPKRSLITVKVHRQVFLLSNSEGGIHFLSEITDTTGIVKEGEKILMGSNFDNEISKSNSDEKIGDRVVLKTSESREDQDKVTFSKQLKEKIKGLRPIHQ